MLGLGGWEIALIAIFGFLIFGPDKLPQIARTIGRGIRQFRSAQDQMNKVIKAEVYDPIKDLEPLVNPFAGFSLDPSKDKKPTSAAAKAGAAAAKKTGDGAAGTAAGKKISSEDMKAAVSAQSANMKEKAKATASKAEEAAKAVANKVTAGAVGASVAGAKEGTKASGKTSASAGSAVNTNPDVKQDTVSTKKSEVKAPAESFAERRARLEREHAKAKAAKAEQDKLNAHLTTADARPAPEDPADARKEDKEGA